MVTRVPELGWCCEPCAAAADLVPPPAADGTYYRWRRLKIARRSFYRPRVETRTV